MKRHILYDALVFLVILLSFLGFLFYASAVRDAVREALTLCGNVLIPSLFPCMVLSTLLIESGAASGIGKRAEKVMRALFRLPGESAVPLFLGLAAGYPVGARSAIALYEAGHLTSDEAERLLAFTNNSGPAFIFGAVGFSLFSSGKAGLILFFSHLAATFTVGLLFRFHGKEKKCPSISAPDNSRPPFAAAFASSVKASALSVLHIAAFVVFFSAAIRVLYESGAIPRIADGISSLTAIPAATAENLLIGLIEMTGGLTRIASEAGTLSGKLAMAAFLLGWAGISVHCQVLSFLGEKKLSFLPYFLGKFAHGAFSALFVFFFARLFPLSSPVSLSESFSGALYLSPAALAALSLLTGGVLWTFSVPAEKKL